MGNLNILDNIINKMYNKWGIKNEALSGSGRSQSVVRARMEAMALIRNETKMSLPEIGKLFNRHHTTVIHAIKVYKNHPEYFDI